MSVTTLREVILPAAFSKQGFTFVGCSLDSEYKGGDQFQSNVVFVTATVKLEKETKEIPLVVKFEPFNKILQKKLNSNLQFQNEIIMYSDILPFLDTINVYEDIFPKFYYGISNLTVPENNVVVIEDLRPKGFKMTDQRVFLDYEHLKLAMEKLGKYHALSYLAKEEKAEKFYGLVKKLRDTRWIDDTMVVVHTIKHAFHRALDPLIDSGRHSTVLRKLLSRVDDSVVQFLRELIAPEEPMAVLCHGDFCRNNILFKYNPDGTPVDVRFFDIATAIYSSPVVDIAFFLFMNSSKEVRAAHWDDLLVAYHKSLTSALVNIQAPSLSQLQKELQLKGIYGFVHTSFFLPMMLFENDFTIDDVVNLKPEEVGIKVAKIGGEEGTRLMIDMVEELFDRGCLTTDHPFLK